MPPLAFERLFKIVSENHGYIVLLAMIVMNKACFVLRAIQKP